MKRFIKVSVLGLLLVIAAGVCYAGTGQAAASSSTKDTVAATGTTNAGQPPIPKMRGYLSEVFNAPSWQDAEAVCKRVAKANHKKICGAMEAAGSISESTMFYCTCE